MGPPPFPHSCRTTPETGEQFSMPIWSVLSCSGIAGNLFLYKVTEINQAVAVNISGFNNGSCHC